MISAVPWRWVDESGQFVCETAPPAPRRQLTIRWDDADQGWFLAVVDQGRPATMGQEAVEPRVFVTPMPLLVAMTLLPVEHHERLIDKVKHELRRTADREVLGDLQLAITKLPTDWPGPADAKSALERAAASMPDVERLSLDLAGSEAWDQES